MLILGGGFFGDQLKDNDYIAHIKQLALPIKERIVFSGFVDYAKVPSYLNIADVAVIPSMWDDPFPTTVLEAMAMGLPVLATVSGGIPEEVDADCSILLPRDASLVERLAGSILQLSRDEALCRRMGEAALRRSKQFPLSDYAKHFLGELNV